MRRLSKKGERGFLLLGVLTTILLLGILSGAVVQEWSIIEKREREAQLIFVQEQYAAAILEYQKGQGALPTDIEQLKEKGQKGELYLRQMYVDPMMVYVNPKGEVTLEDWCLLRISAGGMVVSSCVAEGTAEGGLLGGFGGSDKFQPGEEAAVVRARPSGGNAPGQSGIVGVHSKSTDTAYNAKKFDEETYNLWQYTTEDYKKDISTRNIPGMPSRGGPGVGQKSGQPDQRQQPGSNFQQPDPFSKGSGKGSGRSRGGSSTAPRGDTR